MGAIKTDHYLRGYKSGKTVAQYIQATVYKTVDEAILQTKSMMKIEGMNEDLMDYMQGKLDALKYVKRRDARL